MALRKNKTVPPVDETPQPDTTEVEADATEAKEVVIKQPAGAVAEVGEAMPELANLRNAYPGIFLGPIAKDYRIVGANGKLVVNKVLSLGEFIDIQVISTSFRWMIGPDVAGGGDAKSNKLFRASYDGKTIPPFGDELEAIPLTEWEAEINGAGYPDVKTTKYIDIFCTIFNTEATVEGVKDDDIFQVQVSTTSISKYDAFVMKAPLKMSRGSILPTHQNCIRVNALAITGDKNYTILEFDTVPLDIVSQYTPQLM